MRKLLLYLLLVLGTTFAYAQNPPRWDNFYCDRPVSNDECNYILNSPFEAYDTTDAFRMDMVPDWTASHGTPDINIRFTPPPVNVNYAALSTGYDQNAGQYMDEGIITRTKQLAAGKEYAFSFYRAFSTYTLPGFTNATDVTLKIVLLRCNDIPLSTGDPGEIPDYTQFQHQVIYCEELNGQTQLDYWNHIAFKFTPEDDYDVVWIFAERSTPNAPDVYNDILIANPELIDMPSVVQLPYTREACWAFIDEPYMPCSFSETPQLYYSSPYVSYMLAVTSWPLHLSLTKPGTYYFYYGLSVDWMENNNCSENIYQLPIASVTIGCNDECSCGIETDFDCTIPMQTNTCNMIPNPDFDVIIPSVELDAFNLGNVYDWGYTSAFTADINGYSNPFLVAPPLPAILTGKNYSSMIAQHPQFAPSYVYGESIVAKIEKVEQGKKYAFSFWVASTAVSGAPFYGGNATFTFKAILTDCQNFPNTLNNYPPNLSSQQEIFCERYTQLAGSPWRQYFVSFTADADYEMLILMNDVKTSDPFGYSYLHFAYPELIDITEDYTIDPISLCQAEIGPEDVNCTVLNAQFIWRDPSNTIVYQSTTYNRLTVHLGNAGMYTLSMIVPGATIGNNTCSVNGEAVIASINVPSSCNCSTLEFDTARVEKLHHDDGVIPWPPASSYVTVDLLDDMVDCNTSICHFIDEGILKFHIQSSLASGNVWSIYRDGLLVGSPGSYTGYCTPGPPVFTNQVFIPEVCFSNFYNPTVFEIRLHNGSQQKSIFITMYPQVYMSSAGGGCYMNTTTGMMEIIIPSITYVTPSTQYIWNTSSIPGFVYTQPSLNSPFMYFDPAQPALVGGPYYATVTTSGSQYGCERRRHFTISSDPYQCYGPHWRSKPDVNEKALQVYPNPVANKFTLESSKEIKEVAMYSVNGKLVKRFSNYDLTDHEFDIAELQPGTYCITVDYTGGERETKIIVKQ